MMTVSELLDKICSFPHDNTLYLLEKLPNETGLFVSNGDILYIVPNKEGCTPLNINTEFLSLDTNVYISAFDTVDASFDNGLYNSVKLRMVDDQDGESKLNAFVNLCLAHASNLKGIGFVSFFDSLVSLFQLPKEQKHKNLIGLVGELLFIEYVHVHFGIDLSAFWHSEGSFSRLDFVCPFANFEVKSTSKESLCFSIKHNQLFSASANNYLVAVILEENNAGRTLDDLIIEMYSDVSYCNSIGFAINVEKEKRRISLSELNTTRFILKKVFFYRADHINPFGSIPDCVEDLSYNLDLLGFKDVSFYNILANKAEKE